MQKKRRRPRRVYNTAMPLSVLGEEKSPACLIGAAVIIFGTVLIVV